MNVGRYLRGEDRHVGTARVDNAKAGADIHAGDGGYQEGTQEKHDEFVKVRNQSLAKMRVRELAEQATTIEYGVDNGFDRATLDKEKFAHLIALECAELMEQQHTWITNVAASKAIREHFGVEE
jgi:hypothetical protein